jgi:hypothetical protein
MKNGLVGTLNYSSDGEVSKGIKVPFNIIQKPWELEVLKFKFEATFFFSQSPSLKKGSF